MLRKASSKTQRISSLLHEPTLHFFVLASVLLVGQKLIVGDPRTIEITPAIKADILRRYQDQLNRPLTSAEAAAFVETWKTNEALYREALRQGLDRDDATVRSVLISKMRARIGLQVRTPEPTEAELQQYLEQHRDEFETPLMYEHEYVVFPKGPGAQEKRAEYELQLQKGATPASLGLRSTAANVNHQRIEKEFGPDVAEKIIHLAPAQWHELETPDRLLLVKLIRIRGGLPKPETLHARLVAACKGAMQQKAEAKATQALTERYRFEDASK